MTTDFQKTLAALLDPKGKLSHQALQEFSDIDPASLKDLMAAWPRLPRDRKRRLLEELQGLSEEDTLVSFDDLARALLTDEDPRVRISALRLLDECEDGKLTPVYLNLLSNDADSQVRAAAAAALGLFVHLGELDKVPQKTRHQIEEALLSKAGSDDVAAVRRSALESLGYSSRPEVATLIKSAFQRDDPDWQVSALLAMGLSADEAWEEQVLSSLLHDNLQVQLAAVQSAGELGLSSARTILLNLLEENEDDQISATAIWSLSQIGGEDARVYLQNLLDQSEDDDQIEFLEQALENLAFTEDSNRFDLLSYDAGPDE